MFSSKRIGHTKILDSFCLNDSTLQTKIALMTFYQRIYSDWTEKIILLLEYLQLISQTLQFYTVTSPNSLLANMVLYFFKLVNPSFLMPLNMHSELSSIILLTVLCCMILKYLVFLYVVYIAYRGYQGRTLLLIFWRWIFKIQSRIFCFFMTSFWSGVIIGCSKGTFQVEGMSNTVIMAICSLLILIEYSFSFYMEIHFNSVLPTENFLAAKSCLTQVQTLVQKSSLQILHMIFPNYSPAGIWIFSVFNLVFSAIKIYQCHDKLILYSIKALLLQNRLHSIVISLNLASFAEILLDKQFQKTDMNFVIILWLILTLLVVRASNELLAKRIFHMINMKLSRNHPELLVHKGLAVQELNNDIIINTNHANKFHLSYLFSTIESVNREEIFGIDPKFCTSLDQSEDDESIFIEYLTQLSLKFPNNELVKLHLAHACINNPNHFLKSLKTIVGFTKKKGSQTYLSASLLVYEIGKILVTQSQSTLDLLKYIKSQTFMQELETCVQEQVDLKIKICKNILGETVNTGEIFNYAQRIDKDKQQTRKKVKLLSRDIPDYYIRPFLLIAGYYLLLEYSQENFEKYMEYYDQKKIKYNNYFESLTLKKENMYQSKNVFLILSGGKTDCGQILFCSDSIQNVRGGQVEAYRGKHISSLFTPSFQSYYLSIFKQLFDTEENVLLNRIHRAFICHKDDHIVEVEFYLKIHPYLTQGCYLSMIIRPTNSPKEYLLLKEDGNIEGATKKITAHLNLDRTSQGSSISINVKTLSDELGMVNQAFNRIVKYQDPSKIQKNNLLAPVEYKEALKVDRAYTSEFKRIQLIPMKRLSGDTNNQEPNSYECNVKLLPCGSRHMKIVELEKLSADADGMGEEYIDRSMVYSRQREEIKTSNRENELEYQNDDISLAKSEDIECEENVHNKQMITEWKGATEFNTVGDLLSSPSRKLLTETFENKNILSLAIPTNRTDQKNILNKRNQVSQRDNSPVSESFLQFMSSTQTPNISNSVTANTAFRNAIAINFRPRSFRAICIMFYGVILFTLLSQVILKIVSDSTMEALSVKKTLLSLSQLRTFKMLLISVNSRGNLNNIIDPDLDNGEIYTGMAQTVTNMEGHAKDLKKYNDQIIHNLYFLSDGIQRNLFQQNTKINGSYIDSNSFNVRYVTTFEVINEILDVVHILATLKADQELLVSNQSYHLHNFMIKNIMDDYLKKSQEITDMFVNSVKEEREYFQSVITMCLIVTPLLLVGIVLMLIIIMMTQYNIEKKHMLAFIRLKPKSIKDNLNKLTNFKTKVAGRKSKEIKEWLDSIGDAVAAAQADEQQESTYYQNRDSQVIQNSETRSRYLGYVLRMAFYVLFLIGVILWNAISAQNSAKVIYKRQSQLEFANHLSEIIGVVYCANSEMFESNNTYPVKDRTPENITLGGLDEITVLLSQIPEVFLEEDRTYDPTIENMIFHYDSCEPYNFIPLHAYFCNFLITHGSKITLLPLVSAFREILRTKILDYQTCDNSSLIELFKCAYLNFENWLPTFVLSAIEAQKIGEVVTNNLDRGISDAYYQREIFLMVFSLALVISSILIWLQILRKMRDVYNDFKKVLQIFPPRLILSSFLLRSFLMRHSKVTQK